jgi:hypothetical protein
LIRCSSPLPGTTVLRSRPSRIAEVDTSAPCAWRTYAAEGPTLTCPPFQGDSAAGPDTIKVISGRLRRARPRPGSTSTCAPSVKSRTRASRRAAVRLPGDHPTTGTGDPCIPTTKPDTRPDNSHYQDDLRCLSSISTPVGPHAFRDFNPETGSGRPRPLQSWVRSVPRPWRRPRLPACPQSRRSGWSRGCRRGHRSPRWPRPQRAHPIQDHVPVIEWVWVHTFKRLSGVMSCSCRSR